VQRTHQYLVLRLACFLAACVLLVLIVASTRYQIVGKCGDWDFLYARLDRWTGRLDLVAASPGEGGKMKITTSGGETTMTFEDK